MATEETFWVAGEAPLKLLGSPSGRKASSPNSGETLGFGEEGFELLEGGSRDRLPLVTERTRDCQQHGPAGSGNPQG
jgi:hypothetical protein